MMLKTGRLMSALAITALVAGGVSACSGKADDTATESPEVASARASAAPLPSEVSFDGDWDGAASDVTLKDCALDKGKQTATGTVKNSAKDARDYQIMVMWMRNDDGTPYASGSTIVKDLKAGAEKDFKISVDVPIDVDKCVLNVKAGKISK